MAKVYFDKTGEIHALHTNWYGGNYNVFVNGHLYACADTQAEADEVVNDYIAKHGLSETNPKKKRKKILRAKPASEPRSKGKKLKRTSF